MCFLTLSSSRSVLVWEEKIKQTKGNDCLGACLHMCVNWGTQICFNLSAHIHICQFLIIHIYMCVGGCVHDCVSPGAHSVRSGEVQCTGLIGHGRIMTAVYTRNPMRTLAHLLALSTQCDRWKVFPSSILEA